MCDTATWTDIHRAPVSADERMPSARFIRPVESTRRRERWR